MTHNLEDNSLWYRYKLMVWPKKSPETAAVHSIMRTLRSIRNTSQLAYVSVPITSGKHFYNVKLLNRGKDSWNYIDGVIAHNYAQGSVLLEDIIRRRNFPVLFPADLVPSQQKWEQAHFQALWLSVIAEKSTEIHLAEGWEYSNGGVEEFTHVWQLRLGVPKHSNLLFFNTKEGEEVARERMRSIKVFDHKDEPVTLEAGLAALGHSRIWLRENNLQSEKLDECAKLLLWTGDRLAEGFYQ